MKNELRTIFISCQNLKLSAWRALSRSTRTIRVKGIVKRANSDVWSSEAKVRYGGEMYNLKIEII